MKSLKDFLRPIAELQIVRRLWMLYMRRWVCPRLHRRYSGMSVGDVFSEIYAQDQWGGNKDSEFRSGTGSLDIHTERYCEFINSFIRNHKVRTVVDVGCGDFLVGRKIARPEISYIGLDVVENLIAHNERTFAADHIRFQHGDLTSGSLPDADLCLIRQVLQHLSNKEILLALENCAKYRYVIVTEHVPSGRRVKSNLDKPHGPDVRLYWNSGIFLDQSPFFQKVQQLLDIPANSWSVFRTSLIEHVK